MLQFQGRDDHVRHVDHRERKDNLTCERKSGAEEMQTFKKRNMYGQPKVKVTFRKCNSVKDLKISLYTKLGPKLFSSSTQELSHIRKQNVGTLS